MTKEITVKADPEGLIIDGTEDPAAIAEVVNRLADTYCTDSACLTGTGKKCELCEIGDKCFAIRKRLT